MNTGQHFIFKKIASWKTFGYYDIRYPFLKYNFWNIISEWFYHTEISINNKLTFNDYKVFNCIMFLTHCVSSPLLKMFCGWFLLVLSVWCISLQYPTIISQHWWILLALIPFFPLGQCLGETFHHVHHWLPLDFQKRSLRVNVENESSVTCAFHGLKSSLSTS